VISELLRESGVAKPPLRVGVLIDDYRLLKPFADNLRDMLESNFLEISLVVRDASARNRRCSSGKSSGSGPSVSWLTRKAVAFAAALDRMQNRDCFPLVDCESMLQGVPAVDVHPVLSGPVAELPTVELEHILDLRLDVLIRFGLREVDKRLAQAAKFGIWSYSHDDLNCLQSGIRGLREVLERRPTSTASLIVVREPGGPGLVVAEARVGTRQGFSHHANQSVLYNTAAPLLIWKLRQLYEHGWDLACEGGSGLPAGKAVRNDGATPINSATVAGHIMTTLLQKVARKIKPPPSEVEWRVALRPVTDVPPTNEWESFRWIEAPEGHYYADPFLVDFEGRTWLFVEDFTYRNQRGVISCAEVFRDGTVGEMRVIIERPYHLSFPFVFDHEGEMYMIPESSESGRVELYRATKFPYEWEFDCTLMELPGIDTILHVDEAGKHFFLTTLKDSPQSEPLLILFTSAGLRERWSLHPSGIVCADARYARNGGYLKGEGRGMVRVSQDAVPIYGKRMHFHGIETLTSAAFEERLIGVVEPNEADSMSGTHTYSRSARWEAVDALYMIPAPIDRPRT
jgi:hypothetical protein